MTAKEGETIYNLSRRFGVPADVLMKINGLSDANGLRAGQKVIIPTYVYDTKAPVSAPDSNPKVADAKSSRGNKNDCRRQAAGAGRPAVRQGRGAAEVAEAEGRRERSRRGDSPRTSDCRQKARQSAEACRPRQGRPAATRSQSGDTLSKIAKKNGVSVVALKKANGLNDGLLKIGQTLKLPAGGEQVASAAKPGVDPIVTGAAGPAKKANSERGRRLHAAEEDREAIAEAEDDDTDCGARRHRHRQDALAGARPRHLQLRQRRRQVE